MPNQRTMQYLHPKSNSDGKLYMPYCEISALWRKYCTSELRRQAIGGVIKYY